MHNQPNQLDDALDSLGRRRWPGDYDNQELKENLMQKFDTNPPSRGFGRRGTLLAALAILTVGSVGFAAAGGVHMVRGWFITVEVNAQAVDFNGDAILIEDSEGIVTLTVDGAALGVEGGATGDMGTITIIAAEEQEASIIITDDDGNTTEIRKSGTEDSARDE